MGVMNQRSHHREDPHCSDTPIGVDSSRKIMAIYPSNIWTKLSAMMNHDGNIWKEVLMEVSMGRFMGNIWKYGFTMVMYGK